MDDLVSGLRSTDKLAALTDFNAEHSTFSSKGVELATIKNCLDELYSLIEEVSLQPELLLCCKTLVRDKRVSSSVTPKFFARLLELAQLANIHEENRYNIVVLQARRTVFNITYHNSLCQTACYDAQADLNLFNQLQGYNAEQDYDARLINCKMAFLFTAVSEKMRDRVVDYNGVKILSDIMIKLVYRAFPPHPAKIGCGKKGNVKQGAVVMSHEDIHIATDIYMAMFNVTLYWDKNGMDMDITEDLADFVRFIKFFYEGLDMSEKTEIYVNMVSKFVPIVINTASQFSDELMPLVDECDFKGLCFMSRDMTMPSKLLKQLQRESAKKSGSNVVLLSVLSALSKLCNTRACRKYLRAEIFPPLGKVTKRPEEQSHTVKSKVVKLMTHVDNNIAVLTSELLFTVCKYNVDRMIKYTGYGNSAGLFNRHGLMMLKNQRQDEAMSADENSDTEEYKECETDIDLITAGPARENTALLNMTEEEKEVEANKLINLIDSMHRKGVIKPGGVGVDGKVQEMDIAEQLAKIPDQATESDSDEDLKLGENRFFPRKKAT